MTRGKPPTQRSWLYENLTPDQILEEWVKRLSVLKSGDEFQKNVFHFDISQTEKWGPQGGVAPISDLLELVQKGFKSPPDLEAFKTSQWAEARRIATKTLLSAGVANLRPAKYERVVDDMRVRDTLESNSGWPDFKRRSIPEVKENAVAAAYSGAWREFPAIALFRNYNQKTRLVWMFPMAANLVEGAYFQPLQSRIMNSVLGGGFFVPWRGFEGVRDKVSKAYDTGKCIAASDFSATDEHFSVNTTKEVYEVIAPTFQPQYRAGLWDSLQHLHRIPLIISPNEQVVGWHGVSSGSNWTNFIETVFDMILAIYIRIAAPGSTEHNTQGMYAIGDDMSWQFDSYDPSFAETLERYGASAGQIIQSTKTTNDPNKVKSLQRLFQRGYRLPSGKTRGVYSTVRALKSSVYPERFHKPSSWSSDMFAARQFMILENCVDHPLFEEFVKFVVRGQRDLIPFSKLQPSELTRIHRRSKLLPGLNPTYNQEKKSQSLADFASIRIASKL